MVSTRLGRFVGGVLVALIAPLFVVAVETNAAPQYHYRSLMPGFWLAVQDSRDPEPVIAERFRRIVIEPNRDVCDAVAANWVTAENFGFFARDLMKISNELKGVDEEFAARMPAAWQRFAAFAPGLSRDSTVFLIPAPQQAVGGAVRPMGSVNAAIFGAEEISAALRSPTGFDVLVDHELTHLYHIQLNPEFRRMVAEVYMPPYTAGHAKLYQVLWLEGLAAYMSRKMNPQAGDQETLRSSTVAKEVRDVWPRVVADLRVHLDSDSKEDIDRFLFDSHPTRSLPRRAGYYLGMRVAERLADKRTLPELCRLSGTALRSQVERALRDLEASRPR